MADKLYSQRNPAPKQPKLGMLERFRASIANAIYPSMSASSGGGGGGGFVGSSANRRLYNWNPNRLGPTTILWGTQQQLIARSRDQIRNNPWASSAIDSFQSQLIGTGIRPRWVGLETSLKEKIENAFAQWAKNVDAGGRLDFYGLQSLAAREMFEAGEVFCRMHTRPSSWGLRVPLQLQLIESEQVPIFRNMYNDVPNGNTVRTSIEFDEFGRRIAYHMYKEHPTDTAVLGTDAYTSIRIKASEVLHMYRLLRAGQLRGQPHLTPVLALLYELDEYSDSELFRKSIQRMWAGFIKQQAAETEVLGEDTDLPDEYDTESAGVIKVKVEPGTIHKLLPGEEINFPQLPTDMDFVSFMKFQGHRFAAAIGMTYEQVTADLEGVNYSSIRAGLLNFRRACESNQKHIICQQFCQPAAEAFLRTAVIAGELNLPGYAKNPDLYHNIHWTAPGWDWVDPLKDVQAEVISIRAGLSSRTHSAAERGLDAVDLDAEIAADNKRADASGLVFDSDPRKTDSTGKPALVKDPAEKDPVQTTKLPPDKPETPDSGKK